MCGQRGKERTVVRLSWDDDRTGFVAFQGSLLGVEFQPGFLLERSVAFHAVLIEQPLDAAHGLCPDERCREEQEAKDAKER